MRLLPRSATLAALFLTGCVYAPVDLEGRLPPCVAGHTQVGEACFRDGFDASLGDAGDATRIDATLDASVDVSADAPSACVDFTCDGDTLVNCTSSERVACPGGCVMREGHGACDFVPSFFGCDAPIGTADVVVGAGEFWTIDTDRPGDLRGATSTRVSQGVGRPPLRVISMRSLVLEQSGTIRAMRTSMVRDLFDTELETHEVLVLYVATTAVIRGRIDVSALGSLAGAGSIRICDATCGDVGFDDGFGDGGGGGGGAAGRGGAGGAPQYCGASACGLGDDATRHCLCLDGTSLRHGRGGETSMPEFLMGGSHGGLGGADNHVDAARGMCMNESTNSGGGGGAVMLVAGASIVVGRDGVFAAHGGGGAHGDQKRAGGGGGSGGSIVLEAPVIDLQGTIVAHGGAGGTAGSCSTCDATCPRLVGNSSDGVDRGGAVAPLPLDHPTHTGGRGAMGSTTALIHGSSAPRNAGPRADGDSGGGGGGAGRITLRSVTPTPDVLALHTSPGSTWLTLEGATGCE